MYEAVGTRRLRESASALNKVTEVRDFGDNVLAYLSGDHSVSYNLLRTAKYQAADGCLEKKQYCFN